MRLRMSEKKKAFTSVKRSSIVDEVIRGNLTSTKIIKSIKSKKK